MTESGRRAADVAWQLPARGRGGPRRCPGPGATGPGRPGPSQVVLGVASPRPGLPASDRDRDPPAPLHRDPSIPTVTDSCRVWGSPGPGGPGAPLCGRRNLTPVQGEAAEDGGARAGADVNQRRPSSDWVAEYCHGDSGTEWEPGCHCRNRGGWQWEPSWSWIQGESNWERLTLGPKFS